MIVASDRLACSLERHAHGTVDCICRRFKWHDLDRAEHGLELSQQASEAVLRGTVTQLSCNDNAGANLGFADRAHTLGDGAARIANERGDDVGVEQYRMSEIDRIDWHIVNGSEVVFDRLECRSRASSERGGATNIITFARTNDGGS